MFIQGDYCGRKFQKLMKNKNKHAFLLHVISSSWSMDQVHIQDGAKVGLYCLYGK